MRHMRLFVVLAVMAMGVPVMAGSGDTPGDPAVFAGRNIYFDFDEFVVVPTGATEYEVWQSAGTDSTLVATLAHVGDGRVYSVPMSIVGDPGELNRIRVWGVHVATGLRDHCDQWVMVQEFHGGGCACRAR